MPYSKPESLGDDQTKSVSFEAQTNGRKEERMKTSLVVQPDDLTGKHRDREKNPLKRPQVSEDEDKVIADGTSHANQRGTFVFQAEVGMDLESSQVAARHFVRLPIDRQQRRAIARSTEREENYLIQEDLSDNSTNHHPLGCEITN